MRENALNHPFGEARPVVVKPAVMTNDSQVQVNFNRSRVRASLVTNSSYCTGTTDEGGQLVVDYSTVRFILVFLALALSAFLLAVSIPSPASYVLDGAREVQ